MTTSDWKNLKHACLIYRVSRNDGIVSIEDHEEHAKVHGLH